MKKVKFKVLKGYGKIIAFFLTMFGFISCEDVLHPRVEYGVPHADFIVKGTVVSKETNQPVPQVRVVLADTINNTDFGRDTVYTTADGKYEVKISDFPEDKTYKLLFTDVDGTANGSFAEKDSLVEFKDPAFTGGDGHWYNGKTTKEVDIKLTPGT